ncbi:hypothetical protein FD12_GL001375 [Lentilactobacillus rapi DSM 19907 = JCM 15042]|uniref:Uncharacterized protein n=3 Tax=Lactobacillaceae TaxID=33958 RepID=A0A0R2FFD9_9LACO|nr:MULTISPECIES: hypothetical protein [Lactobacillaceae]KRL17847.1 hypothetical protein FD12_GL001375 [Lentilactobacillus rapi DSM 19907 = JCM 15042]KRN27345.1 hypothetical protein IV38_GL002174 [Lactobacillus selangorensis]GEP72050.1 hypothetical protein LRA02_09180 [Lentilactobacillus rapi]
MLNKNYSTPVLLFAANVIDGGKKIEEVPAMFKDDVAALIKTVAGDVPATDTATKSAGSSTQPDPAKVVDPAKQTVTINPTK